MFSSFFNKKNNKSTNKSIAGLFKEEPILLDSVASSYKYLNSLCTIAEGLSYERIGTTTSEGYQNVIDKYVFTLNDTAFCEIFIYPYHNDCVNIIPEPFKKLNPNASEDIFEYNNEISTEKNETNRIDRFQSIRVITDFILLKHNCFFDEDVKWSSEKESSLNYLMTELGYAAELEKLILDELKKAKNDFPSISKEKFVQLFRKQFHHKKLEQFASAFIQERNEKLSSAFNSIITTINRTQAWLDHELLRKRIEINSLQNNNKNSSDLSTINQCITAFCFLTLGCDSFGRYNITYDIDSRILNMLPGDFANTLLRRIYQFTAGELEPFVGIASLNMDCIKYFENSFQNIENDNYHLIEVERHEEKSIGDMLNKLELKDDVDKKA